MSLIFWPDVPRKVRPSLISNLWGFVTKFIESLLSSFGNRQLLRGYCGKNELLKSKGPGMISTSR